jgi:hypothetical protein
LDRTEELSPPRSTTRRAPPAAPRRSTPMPMLSPTLLLLLLLLQAAAAAAIRQECTFCSTDAAHKAQTVDLASLPNGTFKIPSNTDGGTYAVASPCGCACQAPTLCDASTAYGFRCSPMLQGGRGLGDTAGKVSLMNVSAAGFTLTIAGGSNDPPMPHGRNAVYHMLCDKSVPVTNPPDSNSATGGGVTESPPGYYNVVWRHPSACVVHSEPATCPPRPPPPPLAPPPPPPPPPIPCYGGRGPCLPSWKPTWHMRNSTVLYTCNNSGMHDVRHANKFGVVVYDVSPCTEQAVMFGSPPLDCRCLGAAVE